jgi:hypothetical protein
MVKIMLNTEEQNRLLNVLKTLHQRSARNEGTKNLKFIFYSEKLQFYYADLKTLMLERNFLEKRNSMFYYSKINPPTAIDVGMILFGSNKIVNEKKSKTNLLKRIYDNILGRFRQLSSKK